MPVAVITNFNCWNTAFSCLAFYDIQFINLCSYTMTDTLSEKLYLMRFSVQKKRLSISQNISRYLISGQNIECVCRTCSYPWNSITLHHICIPYNSYSIGHLIPSSWLKETKYHIFQQNQFNEFLAYMYQARDVFLRAIRPMCLRNPGVRVDVFKTILLRVHNQFTVQIDMGRLFITHVVFTRVPDSKVHGTSMGPTWVLSAPDGPILASWTLLWGLPLITCSKFIEMLALFHFTVTKMYAAHVSVSPSFHRQFSVFLSRPLQV